MDKKIEKEVGKILQEAHEDVQKELKSKEKFTINPVEESPFCVVEKNGECFIVCGKIKHGKIFQSYEEAEKYIKKKPWDLMGLLIETLITYLKTNNNGNNKQNN